MTKTARTSTEEHVAYSTKSLPASYRNRMRIIAAYRCVTMEQVLNEALALGLPQLEQTLRDDHARRLSAEQKLAHAK